ncbi:unnamed protein product [Caretta caretta]
MDCGSRFFYALEKKKGAKKHVTCLLAEDGTPLMDLEEMRGRVRAFYAGLFSPDPTYPDVRRVLSDGLLIVSMGDLDRLVLPLTLTKLSEALRLMPTNKSSVMDWLTVEFYHVFWDVLRLDLVTVWAESLASGVLPISCRRAVLTLLPKKGDPRDLRNWHPISLLSTDYKIVAKAISLRLGSMLADVVHPDRPILSWALPSLTICGVCLHGVSGQAQLDPDRTGQLRAGSIAGVPLLGQLYALVIEPFLCLLHQRLTGLVLQEPELWLILSAYANDVLLMVQDPGDLVWVEACQDIY